MTEQVLSVTQQIARQGKANSMWRTRRMLGRVLLYVVLTVFVIIALFPFFWMLSSSFKSTTELFAVVPRMIPLHPSLDSYRNVLEHTPFPTFFVNSLKIATITTVGSILLSIYGAYAMSRFAFRGKYGYGLAMLVTQMFPGALLVIPIFMIIRRVGLFNTHAALIIAYMTFSLPFCTWMLRGFFDSIPAELEEAAMIDGTSRLGALHAIVLPISGPGIAAVAMFAFIRSWNDLLFALVLIQSRNLLTLPTGLASFMEEFTFRWDLLMAGSALTTVPMLFFFIFMQRFIVQGLTAGALKG
jgi:multiple sugar transport system permease protein